MRRFSYPFEPGGAERLVIETSGGYRGAQLLIDNEPVGAFINRRDFKRGGAFELTGGGMLAVKLDYGFFGIGIHVHYNGMPLHVLSRHGTMRLKTASSVLGMIGGLALVLGVMILVAGDAWQRVAEDPMRAALHLIPAMFGASMLILAFFIARGSLGATITATVLFGLNLATVVGSMLTRTAWAVHPCALIIPVLILICLIQALKEVKILIRDRAMWDQLQAAPKAAVPEGKAPPESES